MGFGKYRQQYHGLSAAVLVYIFSITVLEKSQEGAQCEVVKGEENPWPQEAGWSERP